MSETEPIVITRDEMDFNTLYGCMFSLSTSIEYLICVRGIMLERKINYPANKALQAENACQVIYNSLEREITKYMTPEQREIALSAVEYHKQIVYDFFLMDNNDQHRVKQLMDKIKKQRV